MAGALSGSDVGSAEQAESGSGREVTMRYLKYAALIGLFVALAGMTAGTAKAQVRVGIGVGVGPAVVAPVGPPVCAYGYYPYYPYACAPYGYYGPSWFVGGVFIGAGPWYHGFYGRPGYWGHGFYGPGYHPFVGGRGFVGRPGFAGRGPGFVGHGPVARGPVGGFHGGNSFHGGGGGFHAGGGGFHGGGRR